jgi:tRNA(adenine34) deaminase
MNCPFEKKYPSSLRRDDEYYMTLAYNLAIEAYKAEEVPVGALIVKGAEVIASARNQVEKLKDPTAHAEMLCITQAADTIKDWRLDGCILYVTKEPCPMCAGALMLGRINKVIYATSDPKMGGNGGAISIHQLPGSFHRYESQQGPLREDCTALIKAFFEQKRQET